MGSVTLDTRTQEEIFAQAVALAEILTPDWAADFQTNLPPGPRYSDPGLTMLQLFADLHTQLNGPLNAVSDKYRLAFWDFMGIELRPPKAAEAPLWFQLKGSTPVTIPMGTQVVSNTDKSVIFETASDLPLLPATITAAYAVRPEADAYSDYSQVINGTTTPFPLFADDPGQKPITHAMWLSDPSFDTGSTSAKLTLSFSGVNLQRSYFDRWYDSSGAVMEPLSITQSFDQLTAVFGLSNALPSSTINGIDGQWIQVMPAQGVRILPFLEPSLPRIFITSATIDIDGAAADNAYCNGTSLDLKKGAYPLGKQPAVEDAFYIGSKASFSKPHAEITLAFELKDITPPEQAVLVWEYWDGTGWDMLTVQDETRNLTTSGNVRFSCPLIAETKVNKVNNYWIRARLSAGGYGTAQSRVIVRSAADVVNTVLAPYMRDSDDAIAALEADNIDFGYVMKPADFTPPYISQLSISSSVSFSPQNQLAQNGYGSKPFVHQPYEPEHDPTPMVYLGFDPDGFADQVVGKDLTLYIAFQNEDPSLLPTAQSQSDANTLGFEVHDGARWVPISVARLSGDFQSEGILVLAIPEAMKPNDLFGKTFYWLRISPPASGADRLSPIRGIFPNCVAAFNAVAWENVILGSATGEPGQSFTFPHSPVLANPVIQVLETAPGGAAGHDVTQKWVTWAEVSNFDFSGPLDRVYTIDHESGVLAFGDGIKGVVPPKGSRNIMALEYRSGGGTNGNRPIGDLTKLKGAITQVKSVSNVEAAVGGVDADQTSDLPARAPQQIRAGNRAVTDQDFAALAVAASQQVVRAAVNSQTAGEIKVVLLPNYEGAAPLPSYDLRNRVGGYLVARAVPVAASMISVGGPVYVPVAAGLNVVLAKGATVDQATQSLTQLFDAFLMPITGGSDGQGWSFGSTLRASDVASALAVSPFVSLVDGLTLGDDQSFVEFGWDQLPQAGTLTVEVVDANTI